MRSTTLWQIAPCTGGAPALIPEDEAERPLPASTKDELWLQVNASIRGCAIFSNNLDLPLTAQLQQRRLDHVPRCWRRVDHPIA